MSSAQILDASWARPMNDVKSGRVLHPSLLYTKPYTNCNPSPIVLEPPFCFNGFKYVKNIKFISLFWIEPKEMLPEEKNQKPQKQKTAQLEKGESYEDVYQSFSASLYDRGTHGRSAADIGL